MNGSEGKQEALMLFQGARLPSIQSGSAEVVITPGYMMPSGDLHGHRYTHDAYTYMKATYTQTQNKK